MMIHQEGLGWHNIINLMQLRLAAFQSAHHGALAWQLVRILSFTTGKNAKIPHDLLYGILGLIGYTQLPPELLPNYDVPFGQVFQNYAKYMIENTGCLTIMSSTKRLNGYPSWVPDLRYSVMRLSDTAGSRASYSAGSVLFSENGRHLTVQGVQISRIWAISVKLNSLHDQLMHIEKSILAPSASIRGITLEICFGQWFQHMVDIMAVSRLVPRFQSIKTLLEGVISAENSVKD